VAIAARWIPSSLSWRMARRVSSRFSWGIADQAMATLTNFLLSIYVARSLGATQFGAFTLAYLTYGFAINASRGLSIEPLLIRFSGTHLPTWRRATAGCAGTALLVGLVTGICATATDTRMPPVSRDRDNRRWRPALIPARSASRSDRWACPSPQAAREARLVRPP